MHFTYKDTDEESGDLQQGDVLRVSDELKAVLAKFFPYYVHEDYRYLMVTTQSCDLSRREGGECKSKYITLVVVRPLATALNRFLDDLPNIFKIKIKSKGILRASTDTYRYRAEDFLRKLLNNNLPNYFFLAEDTDHKIHDPHVAFLHLSITIKANEHYKSCLDARILQLEDVFQAKLGWLIGNTYSRVGTPDWVPDQENAEDFKNRIESILEQYSLWTADNVLKNLKKKFNADTSEFEKEEIINFIEGCETVKTSKRQEFVGIVVKHITEIFPNIQDSDITKLTKRLTSDGSLSNYIK